MNDNTFISSVSSEEMDPTLFGIPINEFGEPMIELIIDQYQGAKYDSSEKEHLN